MDFPKLVRLGTVLEMTTLSTATIYRPAVVCDSKVDRAIKAEIRDGSGHHVAGYIAPQHGWPETSRQPLRGNFEKAPRV